MGKSQILDNLTTDVEELLGKLGSDLSPDVRDLRDRLDKGIAATKKSATRAGAGAGSALQNYAGAADDYIHDSPWLAVGTAAAAAGVIGFVRYFISIQPPWLEPVAHRTTDHSARAQESFA